MAFHARKRSSMLLLKTGTWRARHTVRTAVLLKPKARSEEHTSELQSRFDLVCRLLVSLRRCPFPTRRSSDLAPLARFYSLRRARRRGHEVALVQNHPIC